MHMRSRASKSLVVLALATGLAWVAPAQAHAAAADPADFRVCHAPPSNAAVESQAPAGRDRPRNHRVRGGACGTAVVEDIYATPQHVRGGGWIYLRGVGLGVWDTTVDATLVTFDEFTTVGTLTVRTLRGSITFETEGRIGSVDRVPGATAHGETTATAVSGTGRFRGVTGSLHSAVTDAFTGYPPEWPLGITLDIWFTLDGTLRF